MKPFYFIMFFCSCLSWSCRKDNPSPFTFNGIGQPTFIWNTTIEGLVPMQPVLYKNKVYFSTYDGFSTIKLVGFDKLDGRKLTETLASDAIQHDWESYYQYENKLIFVNGKGIHAFNLETATFEWMLPEVISHFKGIDSLLFGVKNDQLLKINLLTQTITPIQTIRSAVHFWTATPFFDSFKNENGQMCLVTALLRDTLKPLLTVKNLNTNGIIADYEIPTLGLEGGFSSFFKVFKNKLYYGSSKAIFCRDLISGKLDWSKDYSANGNSIGTNAFFGTNELFIGPYGGTELVALDLKTGEKIWSVPNKVDLVGFGSLQSFYYFNKMLYWGERNLNAIDGNTGAIIWSFNAEFKKPSYLFSGLPSGEGERLYISSGSHALCFKTAQ